jgi:hypothetical protein
VIEATPETSKFGFHCRKEQNFNLRERRKVKAYNLACAGETPPETQNHVSMGTVLKTTLKATIQ